MNRVTKRTWIMSLFLVILLGGMMVFFWEYATQSGRWILAPGSPHLYHGGNIGTGIIEDRAGKLLLDMNGGRTYSSNGVTRTSTMHWLGDRNGFISAGAISHYAGAMSGFDPVNGVYDSSGLGGKAKLTLSSRIQDAAYAALSGQRGTIAVYNYKTGEILCAVTAPSYDPDLVPDIAGDTTGKYEGVYLNRFLQSAYPPGSVFKVVTTAAALECVPDILDKVFICYGRYAYGTEAVTCEAAHGAQYLKDALANSCNCAFAQVAELVGKKNMQQYVDAYQVVAPISFDGVTSVAGNYDISNTGAASFAWSCIGQHSDLINPCRYMAFMGAIANGGRGVEPYIVSEVTCGNDVTYRAKTTKADRIMSEETAKTVQEYMRNTVMMRYGDWRFPGMHVCAKTGTSQLGGNLRSNAMLSGFVMDEAYPLAFVAVVENGGYGGSTCLPIMSVVLGECKAVLDGK